MRLRDMMATFQLSQKKEETYQLFTDWGEEVKKASADPAYIPLPEYPRPQMVRESYIPLNGWWEYAIRKADEHLRNAGCAQELPAEPFVWERDGKILVPFSPESALSGVGRILQPDELLCYRRDVAVDADRLLNTHERLLLHFGSVDQECVVFVNGVLSGAHSGGYLPFTIDLTEILREKEEYAQAAGETAGSRPENAAEHWAEPAEGTDAGPAVSVWENGPEDGLQLRQLTLEVYCRDVSDTSWYTRGKQTLEPHGMFYTPQSGIWQSVWMEWVPAVYISDVRLTVDYDRGKVEAVLYIAGEERSEKDVPAEAGQAGVCGRTGPEPRVASAGVCGRTGAEPRVTSADGPESSRALRKVRQIFDFSQQGLADWTPEDPALHPLELSYGTDHIQSYFAMRCFSVEEDAQGRPVFCLNHKPYFLNGVLDQGYWPEGLYTAPSDDALLADIVNMKNLGFNMLRKHCKIEPLRWYYHCDRLGMIVWQDMVSGGSRWSMPQVSWKPTIFTSLQDARGWSAAGCGRLDEEGRKAFVKECLETIRTLYNVPSLACWVIFNEGWGQFSTEKLTGLIRKADPTRPIDAASGWFDFGSGDFVSEHNYFRPLKLPVPRRNAARMFVLKEKNSSGRPVSEGPLRAAVISEYGGLAWEIAGHVFSGRSYGYRTLKNAEEFGEKYEQLMADIMKLKEQGLSGAVYTQVTDIEEEINGLYTYDRKICKVHPAEQDSAE